MIFSSRIWARGWRAAVIMTAALGADAALAQQPFDVVHWSTGRVEAKAMRVIVDALDKRGVKWVDSAVATGAANRAAVMNRVAAGQPPAAAQWSLGKDLRELADNGILYSPDKVATQQGWARLTVPVVVNAFQYNNHTIAIPVGLQSDNWMFYNAAIYKELGLKPATSWDEFLAQARKIKAAGYTPIAMAGDIIQRSQLFRDVLQGVAGAPLMARILVDNDAAAARDPKVLRAFEVYRALKGFTDQGQIGRTWSVASGMVVTKKAAVQFVGDWAKAQYRDAGKSLGDEIGCALAPGNTALHISINGFILPRSKEPGRTASQNVFAEVVMSPAVQREFNLARGTLPVRRDVDTANFDVCTKQAAKVIANPQNALPNLFQAFDADSVGKINDLLSGYWSGPTMTPAQGAAAFARIVAAAHK
ncbi:MAG: ABC transporter substrate-binding protein [Luteimonas sp.]